MSDSRRSISAWMRLQSYLTDVLLEKVDSDHSEELELILRNNKLILQTPRVFYSYEDRYGSFREAFAQQPPLVTAEKLLVLGFGMGSIPIILDRIHNLQPQVTGLEIDGEIIALAEAYLDKALMERITLLRQDARNIGLMPAAKYDLICVDVFLDDLVPASLSEKPFLNALRSRLAPKGQLYFSRLDEDGDFARRFRQIFPGAAILKAGQNKVWYWQRAGV